MSEIFQFVLIRDVHEIAQIEMVNYEGHIYCTFEVIIYLGIGKMIADMYKMRQQPTGRALQPPKLDIGYHLRECPIIRTDLQIRTMFGFG